MPGTTDLQHLPPGAAVEPSISTENGVKISNGSAVNGVKQHETRTSNAERFQSCPNREVHQDFVRRAVDILIERGVFEGTNRRAKVLEWKDPEKLKETFDLALKDEPVPHDVLLDVVEDTIKYSVKTGHPHFINQLFSSLDPYGLVGQWLTDTLNPSVYTYEVAPVFTLMEEAVLQEMRRIVGFPEGDGIFCPGGSMANGYAVNCARHWFMPDIKAKGLHGRKRLVLFTSEDAHYSIKKMAALEGIGSDNVYLVKCDAVGKMNPQDLERQVQRALEEDAAPFMVSATAGTTVLGAFDPLEEIAEICARYKLWLHVDAAWGGGALMSKKWRHLLKGVEKADSVTWNPHKLLAAPQQCSTFLLRHPNLLTETHSASAQYLFQKDKFYDTKYDTGDKHVQCGRRADVVKFWFMWKAKGTSGLEKHIDTVFDNAIYFTEQLRKREDFKLMLPNPECTNVCFWYIPQSLKGKETELDFNERLHKVAPVIKERMMKEGTMMVTYQPLRDHPNFFRLVLQNSSLEHKDMDYFIEEFARLGSDL